MAGKFAIGEFFDGNLELISNWVFNPTGMRGRVRLKTGPPNLLALPTGHICLEASK
jgi:hypothetical protein